SRRDLGWALLAAVGCVGAAVFSGAIVSGVRQLVDGGRVAAGDWGLCQRPTAAGRADTAALTDFWMATWRVAPDQQRIHGRLRCRRLAMDEAKPDRDRVVRIIAHLNDTYASDRPAVEHPLVLARHCGVVRASAGLAMEGGRHECDKADSVD